MYRRVNHDVAIASGLFIVGLVLYFSGLYPLGTGHSEVHLGVRVIVLAVMCATGLLRRSRPPVALVAGALVFAVDLSLGPSVPVWIVLADLLYAAVLHGSARFSRYVTYGTGLAIGALAAVFLVATGDAKFTAGAVVVTALFFGTSLWWGLAIRRQVEITAIERERAKARELLAERDRDAAVARERNTMARDLHDVIAGHLSAIAIHAEVALTSDPGPSLRPVLEAIRTSSTAGLSEMRSMIEVLEALVHDPRTSPHRVGDLDAVLDVARATGGTVDASIDVSPGEVPTVVDQTAYRIAHEAVTNAMKHAPGQPIHADIHRDSADLVVQVRNSITRRTPTATPWNRGIANMKHRAHLLGGTMDAGVVDHEWVVSARLPLERGAS